jgi:hypothetical protein
MLMTIVEARCQQVAALLHAILAIADISKTAWVCRGFFKVKKQLKDRKDLKTVKRRLKIVKNGQSPSACRRHHYEHPTEGE